MFGRHRIEILIVGIILLTITLLVFKAMKGTIRYYNAPNEVISQNLTMSLVFINALISLIGGIAMNPLKNLFRKIPNDLGSLESMAMELKVSLAGTGVNPPDTYEMQRRIREAISHSRSNLTWVIALVSALASVVSALAAWSAVSLTQPPG